MTDYDRGHIGIANIGAVLLGVLAICPHVLCLGAMPEGIGGGMNDHELAVASAAEVKSRQEFNALRNGFSNYKPRLSADQVVSEIRRRGRIDTEELRDMAIYYSLKTDRRVVQEVVAALPKTVKSRFGDAYKGAYTHDPESGTYPVPLFLLAANHRPVRLILHRELLRYSRDASGDPHLLNILMASMPGPEYGGFAKAHSYIFFDDLLAYLRVCAACRKWPELQTRARESILWYRDVLNLHEHYRLFDDTLKLAERTTGDGAFTYFMERYTNNYRFDSRDTFVDQRDPAKAYKQESEFWGWTTEHVKGISRVYGVDGDEAVIGVEDVDAITKVIRDGKDITQQCTLSDDALMLVPLIAGDVVELEYYIAVTAWWRPR